MTVQKRSIGKPVSRRSQMRDDLGGHGYSETPGDRVINVTSDIAMVRQDFTMNFRHRASAKAVDIFGLVRQAGSWRIVSVLSDVSAAPNPPGSH